MSAVAKATKILPGSAEWHLERGKRLGASDAAGALGWSRYIKPRELAERKRAALAGTPFPPTPESQAMHRGHVLEAVVGRLYERKIGICLSPSEFLVHPEHDWMSATPDWSYPGSLVPGGLVQGKTHLDFLANQYGAHGSSEIPDNEFVQIQHEMAVTGDKRSDLAVLFGSEQALDLLTKLMDSGADLESVVNLADNFDFRVFPIARDSAFIADLIAAEKEFWDRYVLGSEIPDDIQTCTPRDNIRSATQDEESLLARLCAAYCLQKDSEAAYKLLRPQVEDAIGRDAGIEGQAGKITWKGTASSEATVTNWEGIAVQLLATMPQAEIDTIMAQHTETVQKGGGRRFCVYPADRKKSSKK